jgi:glycine betaine/choline ABC-type transport system substrate-binding protein
LLLKSDRDEAQMQDLSAGSVFAGHRIEAVAGRGGMGVVYRAIDLDLERRVALKVIVPEYASDAAFQFRFKRESRLAASIRHPNVVTVYRAGEADDLLYITMDYIDGTDMRAMIERAGRLEPRLAVRIVAQVASALDAAHAGGLVHRDVKPANVLVSGAPGAEHAYLTDFGLTKHATSDTSVTASGVVLGTLDYIAPEQVAGEPLDARADVYALGCVLFHTLTGQVPFPRDTQLAKMYAHAEAHAPPLRSIDPSIPREFELVVARAMAKRPDERYPSAGDVGRAALAAATGDRRPQSERMVATGEAAGSPVTVREERPPPVQPPQPTTAAAAGEGGGSGRGAWWAIAAVALVALLVGTLAVAGVFDSGDGAQPAASRTQPTATKSAPADPTAAANQAIQSNPANAGKSVTVGSKSFTEQFVLGNIYAEALGAAGYDVKRRLNLGSANIAFKALGRGRIDAYPEYTGTVLTSFYGIGVEAVPRDPSQAFEQASRALAGDDITALPQAPLNDSYRLAVTKDTAAAIGNPTKISDLAGKEQQLRIAGLPACEQKEDCLPAVQRTYGLGFERFVPVQSNYEALDQGRADVAFVFATDSSLVSGDYVDLDDDKNAFAAFHPTLLVRDDKLAELGPDAQRVVEMVQRPLTTEVMRELNARVEFDKKTPADVAREYLEEEGFTRPG